MRDRERKMIGKKRKREKERKKERESVCERERTLRHPWMRERENVDASMDGTLRTRSPFSGRHLYYAERRVKEWQSEGKMQNRGFPRAILPRA